MHPGIGALRDAVYDLQRPWRSWLAGLAEGMAPLTPGALGRAVVSVRLTPVRCQLLDVGGADAPLEAFVRTSFENAPMEQVLHIARRTRTVGSHTEWVEPLGVPNFWETFRHGGVQIGDFLGIRARDGGDRFITLGALYSEPYRTSDRLRRALEPLAAHVAAMVRLRRAVGQSVHPEHGEAVLEVDGRVVHAEGRSREPSFRELLREGVLRRERARTRASTAAGALWEPLVAGRWTLVDQVESDRRRHYLAIRNDPRFRPLASLSKRERQVTHMAAHALRDKEIAYALDLSPSTVRTLLARAMAKLRVRHRTQLPLLLEDCVRSDGPTPDTVQMSLPAPDLPDHLTRAESEVMRLALQGLSDRAIGEARGTSARTTANLLQSAYRKLGVESRTEAMRALLRVAPQEAADG